LAVAQASYPGLDDVGRRIEIGLADLQVNDLPALGFQGLGLSQNLERSFCAEPGHTLCQLHS